MKIFCQRLVCANNLFSCIHHVSTNNLTLYLMKDLYLAT